jgi:hypothetical protein
MDRKIAKKKKTTVAPKIQMMPSLKKTREATELRNRAKDPRHNASRMPRGIVLELGILCCGHIKTAFSL